MKEATCSSVSEAIDMYFVLAAAARLSKTWNDKRYALRQSQSPDTPSGFVLCSFPAVTRQTGSRPSWVPGLDGKQASRLLYLPMDDG